MIAAMRVLAARRALLFDVGNLPARRHFPIVARDAAAAERRETEETNKTHHGDPPINIEQFLYRMTPPRQRRIASECAHRPSPESGVFSSMTNLIVGTNVGDNFQMSLKNCAGIESMTPTYWIR